MHLTTQIQIPADDSRPGLPGKLEILGRRVERDLTGSFEFGHCHVQIGRAAAELEAHGVGWHHLSSPEQVVTQVEAVRALAAHPLVTTRQLPASWLKGADGKMLGVDGLAAIETAIELAVEAGECWRQWVDSTTAIAVIAYELPRLQAPIVEAKVETPVPTPDPVVQVEPTTAPAKPSEQRLHGAARKAQRQAEAEARQAKADVRALAAKSHKRGEVFMVDGIQYVICTGFGCERPVLLTEARVAKSIGSVMHALHAHRFSEITEANLPSISFCKGCANRILRESQTIQEALIARDAKIAEAEAYQAHQRAEAEAKTKAEAKARAERNRRETAERLRRQKANRAGNGGAFGKDLRAWMSSR